MRLLRCGNPLHIGGMIYGQVYQAHGIPTYVIFDNDFGVRSQDRDYNKVICRLLEINETDAPAAQIKPAYAILGGDWEAQMKGDLERIERGLYDALVAEARQTLGIRPDKNKPLVARYVAERLIAKDIVPAFVTNITRCLKQRVGLEVPTDEGLLDDDIISLFADPPRTDKSLDDEIPF
jgi:hypothetical protein